MTESELVAIRRAVRTLGDRGSASVYNDLLAHVDFLEGAMTDLLADSSLLVEQGVAAERSRIRDLLGDEYFRFLDESGCSKIGALTAARARLEDRVSTAELLPPLAARLELERLRRENEQMRKALDLAALHYIEGSVAGQVINEAREAVS